MLAAVPLAEPDPDFDPAEQMRLLAGRLVAAHRADLSNAALARECRLTLLAIAGMAPDGADDDLAELRALFEE